MRMHEACLGLGLALWACLLLAFPPAAALAWPDLTQVIAILPKADDPVVLYATVAWLTGTLQIAGALCNMAPFRRAAAIAAFIVWSFVAGSLVGHQALAPKIAAYVTLALLNIPTVLGRRGHVR